MQVDRDSGQSSSGLHQPGTPGWPLGLKHLRDGPLSPVFLGGLRGGYGCSKKKAKQKGLQGRSWGDQIMNTFWLADKVKQTTMVAPNTPTLICPKE